MSKYFDMSVEELEALSPAEQLVAMQEMVLENKKLKATTKKGLSIRVSAKGAISIYGLGRFPVTLYWSQWVRLIELIKSGALEAFATDNESSLSVKETE
jgi:hypothetical protein